MTELAPHPAKYSEPILDVIGKILISEQQRLERRIRVFDPFAGTGLIHRLYEFGKILTFGYELEPEWASYHDRTMVGDSLNVAMITGWFDVIATSCTYGNRMADHHVAKDASKRMTYTHQLGRPLTENNSGAMPWGPVYRNFHINAWIEQTRILRPGGLFILNVKDFYRTRTIKRTRVTERVEICQWHLDTLTDLGYTVEQSIVVPVRGMRMGANHKKRMGHEMVYALRRK